MSDVLLDAAVRESHSKGYTKQLRLKGYLPGVIYGMEQKSLKIAILLKDMEKALAKGGTQIITLNIAEDGNVTRVPAMIREVQKHPIKGAMTHIDFYRVSLTEKLTAEISISLTGEAKGVKEGGILQQSLRIVEVECLPGEIPDSIGFDVAELDFGDQVLVRDLTLPPGVELVTAGEKLVASIVAPRVVEEETTAEEKPDLAKAELAEGEAKAEEA